MGISWKFRVTTRGGMTRQWDPAVGALMEVRIPGEVIIIDQDGPTAEEARRSCAFAHGVELNSVEHMLDSDGQPVFREYADQPQGVLASTWRHRSSGFGH